MGEPGEGRGAAAFALRGAPDVDAVARVVLRDLLELPGAARAGIALAEGGGRRLRFLSSEADGAWTHIDAYDDVPLTAVTRTGDSVYGPIEELRGRFHGLPPDRIAGMQALAALPLPGVGSPIGGLIVLYDRPQAFDRQQRQALENTARRTAQAVRRVRATTGRAPAEAAGDDPALVGRPIRSATVLLEGDPQAAGAARHFVRELLADWQVGGDAVDAAQVCLSELVTNAVIHAGTTSELTVHLEENVLRVIVRDLGGSSRPGDVESIVCAAEEDDPLRVFGRGLTLVDSLADRWGSERDGTGTTSWFVLELDNERESVATG